MVLPGDPPPNHKWVSVACSQCGFQHKFVADCKDRTCEFCQRKRQVRIIKRFKPIVSVMKNPILITLTVKRSPLCRAAIDRIRKCFTRLRHSKIWSATAGVYQIEVGIIDDLSMTNIHIHTIADSPYVDQVTLSKAWNKATRGWGYIVDVRRAQDTHGALKYLTKHMGKRIPWVRHRKLVNQVFEDTHLVQGYGTLCNIKMRCWDTVCPQCGAVNSYVTCFDTLFFDVLGLK